MASADNDNTPAGAQASGGKCPICGKPTVKEVRPFCSSRCAEIDLGRWMSGSYLIAGGQADADEDGEDTAAMDAGRKRPQSEQDGDE